MRQGIESGTALHKPEPRDCHARICINSGEVNDRYGHPRGDALLRMAATTLRNSLRTSDYAFRIGGDEFALLLVQSDAEQAITLGTPRPSEL